MVNKTNSTKKIYCILAFVISIVTYAIILRARGIIPFGDNTMLVHDMSIQYSAFMSWFNDVLNFRTSFWYSLRGGLGGSSIGLFSYYLASPINLLLIFFDEKSIPYGVMLLLALKLGLSALNMELLLYNHKQNIYSVIFAVFYALSSYSICYQFNIMWMDAYLLLPLIVLGLEQLYFRGKGALYAVTLGLCVLGNYYIGFMVCLFAVIYFIGLVIRDFVGKSAGAAVKNNIIRFAVYSVLGGLLSFGIVLPGVLTLSDSSSSRILGIRDFCDLSLMVSPITALKYIFAGCFDMEQGIWGTYPMLYAGAFSVLLFIIFFADRKTELKDKLSALVVLILLWIGMFVRGAFLIWHGFCVPSGCYERNAFLWVFVVLLIAYKGLFCLEQSKKKLVLVSTVPIIIILTFFILKDGLRIAYLGNIILPVTLAFLYIKYTQSANKLIKNIIFAISIILCVGELSYNGIKLHEEEFTDRYVSYVTYLDNVEEYRTLVKEGGIEDAIQNKETENLRAVILNGFGESFNKGYVYNLNSINTYSSSEKTATWTIYGILGLGTPGWESDDEYDGDATGLTADILSVRYLFEDALYPMEEFKKLSEDERVVLYENEDALPLAFLVNENAEGFAYECVTENTDLFEIQNELLNCLYTGERDRDTDGGLDEKAYNITGYDEHILDAYPDYRLSKNPRIFKLGTGIYTDGRNIAEENTELINNTVSRCASYTESVTVAHSHINAVVNVPKEAGDNSKVCLSIPYEKGLVVKIDGRRTEPYQGLGGFVLLPITEGRHEIIISYNTKGLWTGILLSLLALAGLIFVLRKPEALRIAS